MEVVFLIHSQKSPVPECKSTTASNFNDILVIWFGLDNGSARVPLFWIPTTLILDEDMIPVTQWSEGSSMLTQCLQCFDISFPQRFFLEFPGISPLWVDLRVIKAHDLFVNVW